MESPAAFAHSGGWVRITRRRPGDFVTVRCRSSLTTRCLDGSVGSVNFSRLTRSSATHARFFTLNIRTAAKSCRSELLQHAHVVLEQRADVRDVVLDHRGAVESESERESAPHIGIDPYVAQHLRMNHSAAEDLHPAREGAGVASLAATKHARHVDFRRWLREGEVARTHAHREIGSEQTLDELLERRAQMADVNAFVDEESFRLMKDRRSAHRDLVAEIHTSA